MNEERYRNDKVPVSIVNITLPIAVEMGDSRSKEQKPFKPITPSIPRETTHHNNRHGQNRRLERIKAQRHRPPNNPAHHNQKRCNKQ
jgi:hypothetical protein